MTLPKNHTPTRPRRVTTPTTDLRERLTRSLLAQDGRRTMDAVGRGKAVTELLFIFRDHLAVPETVERVARAYVRNTKREAHGQRCPVWTQKADADRCDCFVLDDARWRAQAMVDVLAAVMAPDGYLEDPDPNKIN